MSSKIIIAIDGTSSTGKSTLAKRISKKLNYKYIDSGAMYRALTYYSIQQKYISKNHFDKIKLINDIPNIYIDFRKSSINNKFEVHLNGIPYENKMRSLTVSNLVSEIATVDELRQQMVRVQHSLGFNKGVIMDGRDIGTVVFPAAEFKFYVDASPEIRAKRRLLQLRESGEEANYEEIITALRKRDFQDQNRKVAPLKPAEDAIIVDTGMLSADEVLQHLLDCVLNEKEVNQSGVQ